MPETATDRSTRIRDRWTRDAIQLVGVENAVVESTLEPLTEWGVAVALLLSRLGNPDDELTPTVHRAAETVITERRRSAWQNAIGAFSLTLPIFVSRWFGVQARAIVPRLRAAERRAVSISIPDIAIDRSRRLIPSGTAPAAGPAGTPAPGSPIIIPPVAPAVLPARVEASGLLRDLIERLNAQESAIILSQTQMQWYVGRMTALAQADLAVVAASLQQSLELRETLQEAYERVVAAVRDKAERDVNRIVRTQMQQAAFETEQALLEYLSPAVQRVQYFSMLDSRTCIICGTTHGQVFRVDDANRPTLPRHGMCRCFYAPIIGSDDPSSAPEYGEWLADQSPDVRRRILGPGRAQLFDEGLAVERFTNSGRIVPLNRLPLPEDAGGAAEGAGAEASWARIEELDASERR